MRTFLALSVIFLGAYAAAAVSHSLQYFYTASSGIPNFPEFVTVGMLDGQPFIYYDTGLKKTVPKQDWIAKNEGPDYWERETQVFINTEQVYKVSIGNNKQYFNQTGGVHVFQRMYGCEWNDETDEMIGYSQWGYDGEDYIAFDFKTETFITPIPQALITKHKWDSDRAYTTQEKNYFTQICPDWLKKYVNYGRSSLMRTVLPSVFLLQKTPSSPVSCHATGFYPDRAEMVWRKDGLEIHEGVDKDEILSNNDGTFQMSVDLKLSSVKPEDWQRYDCVFQLSGEKDIVTKLDKAVIKTNEGSSESMIIPIIVAAVVLAVIAVIGLIIYKKKTDKRPPSPVENRDVQEQMIPKA